MPGKPTLLCVDDEQNVLEVLARMFERNCEVLTAPSGEAALEVLRKRTVDLLITDQKMPHMTGIELVQKARAEGIDVMTILLTGYTNPTDLIAAINEGQVYRYVTKPWDVNDLSITVKNALEVHALKQDKERLLDSLRKRIEALNVMYEVSRSSAREARSLDAIVDRLLATAGRALPHDCSAVLIQTGEGSRSASLKIRCNTALGEGALLTVKESVLFAHRKSSGALLPEERVITNVTGQPTSAGGLGTFPSILSVPLIAGGHPVGTLSIFSGRHDAYTTEDGELLDLLVNHTTDAITHLRAAERDARVRIEQMVETMADGVVLTDEKGDIAVLNGAARTLLQLPTGGAEQVTLERINQQLGLSLFDIVRGWEYGGRKTFREELKLFEHHVALVVAPVVDPGRALRGVLVVLHDITEQKLLEDRKGEFVSVVSHELRTPLTSIIGAIDLVLNNLAGDINDKQQHFLQMAKDSTERLNGLVDDLLDMSKLESGKLRMNFEFTQLEEVARKALDTYGPAMAEKQLTVALDAPGQVRVLADPNRITQVLNNLLTNCKKFAPKGGQVRVSVGTSPAAPNLATVAVWNSGEPIPEINLERIFDRFEQARTDKLKNIPGTGLGLAISRSIVEAHGGKIWAEPSPDGARFVFVLPAEPPAADTLPQSAEQQKQRSSRGLVLVVDDDALVARAVKAMLMRHGYRAMTAATGDEALTLARKHHPDCVLLDQRLPDMEGTKLLEIFRHDPDTRAAQVVMMSGHDVREGAMAAGAGGFLMKPLTSDKLVASLDGIMADAGHRRGRILVVDDDPQIVAICAEVLRNLGFDVDGAGTVAEARRLVREQRPDMLLLDVMLPDGDGLSFFEELKAERASGPLSVVFISARADTSAKVRALKMGGDDYLTKPFDALELGARVESVLKRRSAAALASPTTQLPGSAAIEREVQGRIAARSPFAFCYLDLDNLKAYNDYYGFAKADGVVRQTGDLLRDTFMRHGAPSDFVGHVAGDDFVFICTLEKVDELCLRISDSFDRLIPLYYDRADRERGYIEADDRFGERRRFAIMTVSIVAVLSDGTRSHAELARHAAEMKMKAKAIRGSVYLRSDRDAPVRPLAEGA